MGGGGIPGGSFGTNGNILAAIATMGLSVPLQAGIRSANDPMGMKNAASNATTAQNLGLKGQETAAADLQHTLLTQPKQITPDNFLAAKASQLAQLRLGLASTVTGTGGAPSSVLSAPSLTGTYPGKTKLGQ